MADVSMNVKILHVTKTTSQWAEVTDVISKGLLCIELDANEKSWAKVGDGVHTFAELPYITDGAIESLGSLLRAKGVVASESLLPSTGNKVGDVYFVGDSTAQSSDKFEEYVWTMNNAWEFIGKISDPPLYTGGTGITVTSENVINHSNSVTAGTAKGDNSKTLTFGGTFTVPSVTYDAQGHITAKGTTTMTMPANPNTTYTLTQDSTDGHKITLTPSSGTAQTVTIPDNDTKYGISGAYGGTGNSTWVTTITAGGTGTSSTVPTASTSVYGITKLSSATDSTSTSLAATPSAVKAAYDLANGKSVVSVGNLSSSGISIGTITINGTDNAIKVPTGTTASTVAIGNHTHATTIAAGATGDTSALTMQPNTKYKLTAGGTNYIFTTPSSTVVSVGDTVASGTKIASITIDGTTTDINLQTTAIESSSSSDAADVTLAANTKYKLTAGNNSIVFQTPPNTTYQFADTYNASTNKGATVATVTNAINALDVPATGTGAITGMGAGKTIATLTETNGKIGATFQDISITASQVSNFATAIGNAGYIKNISINGTSGTSFTKIAKTVKVNNGTAVAANDSGQISLTGIATALKYTNASGTAATLTPDASGNLDVTSLILNCTL